MPPPDHHCLRLVLTLLHASHKKSASHGFPGDLTQPLGRTRKPQTLNWFWSQDSSYSNGPTSNSQQTTLKISSSKKKVWKNKHATITSVLPLLLISTLLHQILWSSRFHQALVILVLCWRCTSSRRCGSHGGQLDEKSSRGYGGKASRVTPQAQGSSLGQSRKRQYHVLISNTVI